MTLLYNRSMKNEVDIYFGNSLRKIRESRCMSQADFAEACSISRAYYGRIERGEHSATVEMCDRIATALGLHISDLFIELP